MKKTIDLEHIYNELVKIKSAIITRDEMDGFLETVAILSNPSTMKQIIASQRDIGLGNVKEINSVSDF